jgi:anti-anti-sigma regulatory factor
MPDLPGDPDFRVPLCRWVRPNLWCLARTRGRARHPNCLRLAGEFAQGAATTIAARALAGFGEAQVSRQSLWIDLRAVDEFDDLGAQVLVRALRLLTREHSAVALLVPSAPTGRLNLQAVLPQILKRTGFTVETEPLAADRAVALRLRSATPTPTSGSRR